MKKLEYRVSFTTPAFLGNAEQQAQWRTPPFKALIRQWWRVAYAADHGFHVKVADMRREEGLLFGNAWLSHREGGREVADHRKSLVRIRLDVVDGDSSTAWKVGTQKGVAPLPTDLSTSYAWFGLVKRGGNLPDRTGIRPVRDEGPRILRLSYPSEHETRIDQAIRLIHAFGQLGSRSRGGWGSVRVADVAPFNVIDLDRFARSWSRCLDDEWAISFGKDEKGLWIWESVEFSKPWHEVMKAVAAERRQIRTALKSVGARDLRIALGFAAAGRMPSPLRWKLVEAGAAKVKIRVFALPHRLPADSGKQLNPTELTNAWQTVRDAMDSSTVLKRGMA